MSGSGKGLLGLWLYRSGESEWAVKEGSPLHKKRDMMVSATRLGFIIVLSFRVRETNNFLCKFLLVFTNQQQVFVKVGSIWFSIEVVKFIGSIKFPLKKNSLLNFHFEWKNSSNANNSPCEGRFPYCFNL